MDINVQSFLYYPLLLAFLTSLGIAWYITPAVVKVVRLKKLLDKPGERSAHVTETPTLGGVGIFIALILSICLWANFANVPEVQYIFLGVFLIFFLGVADDLVLLSPSKKFLFQLMAVWGVIALGDIRLESLEGLLGIHELPYWASTALSTVLFVFLINAYNLIDGIDGLAAGLGIIACVFFAIAFGMAGDVSYGAMAMAFAGALAGFLRFNFSVRNKIFMGDTGSMLLGFMLAVFAIRFLRLENFGTSFGFQNSPVLVMMALIVPIFDTLRVFFIRLLNGRSPFFPDKNHVHHILIKQGLGHAKATLVLCGANIALIAFTVAFFPSASVNVFFACFSLVLFFSGVFIRIPKQAQAESIATEVGFSRPVSKLPKIVPPDYLEAPVKKEVKEKVWK